MTNIMEYLLACNILDIVTGFIKAYDQKNVSSKKMKHGALSKISIWVVVVVSIMVSNYLNTDLTTYVVGYYLVMEVISIFENVSVFIPVPEKLKDMLATKPSEKTPEPEPVNETAQTVDPEILERIKEMEENE